MRPRSSTRRHNRSTSVCTTPRHTSRSTSATGPWSRPEPPTSTHEAGPEKGSPSRSSTWTQAPSTRNSKDSTNGSPTPDTGLALPTEAPWPRSWPQKRNGKGIVGIAYDATLAAYNVDVKTESDLGMRWLIRHQLLIANSSVGGSIGNRDPGYLTTAARYVANGGVIVYASGNRSSRGVQDTARAPVWDPSLEDGWLAVVDLKPDGYITDHANRCGNSAPWCLAAPGSDLVTIQGRTADEYRSKVYGTSYAAPMVTAGIAALKSLFPTLTYQQIRDRVLRSADRTGQYAKAHIYGQGRLDLQSAAHPIDGTHLPTGTRTNGPSIDLDNASVTVGAHTARALAGIPMIVVDGYQQAPFRTRGSRIIATRRALVGLDVIDPGYPQATPPPENSRWCQGDACPAHAASAFAPGNAHAIGVGTTLRSTAARLTATATPTLTAPGTGAGMRYWGPAATMTAAFGHQAAGTIGIDLATGLAHPGGIVSTGTLKIDGQALAASYRRTHSVGPNTRAHWTGIITRLERRSKTQALRTRDTWIAGLEGQLIHHPGSRSVVEAKLRIERDLTGHSTSLRLASDVEPNGKLHQRTVTLDNGGMNDVLALSVRGARKLGPNTTASAGFAFARDGAGTRGTAAALHYRHTW